MNRKILFIGEHPAYLGGITRKCEVLKRELLKYHKVDTISINVKNNKILSFGIALLKMLVVVKKYDGLIYCLDNQRMYLLLKFQRFFWPNTLKKTVVVYSGGSFVELIDDKYRKAIECIKCSKQLWIEIKGIEGRLLTSGYKNIVYYPNPRVIEVEKRPQNYSSARELKLLYYSQISKEKGLMDVIRVVKILNERYDIAFTIDFYGLIKEDVEKVFNDFIKETPNAFYAGFNNAQDLEEYYSVLNQYDIMLFPSCWVGEGIAGACVEAKTAGVAIIASKHNYNSEIVDETKGEGALYEKGDVEGIARKVYQLYSNPDYLNEMKNMSFDSKKRYDVKAYQDLYNYCFD